MRILRIIIAMAIVFIYMATSTAAGMQNISITDQETEWIGNKIFRNECAGKDKFLINWNDGEGFISLGIGHFIWYPENRLGPFDESFPDLLKFIKENGRELPGWLQGSEEPRCPWQSKEEFLRDAGSPKVHELRIFLMETKDLQLLFIVNRLKAALPKLLEAVPEEERHNIEKQFYRVSAVPAGMYALIDYVNFRGEGLLVTERYKGKGWGLLQVLERMNGTEVDDQAVLEFVRSAEETLTERVDNSPPERNEKKWLCGWKKRLNTYIDALEDYPR